MAEWCCLLFGDSLGAMFYPNAGYLPEKRSSGKNKKTRQTQLQEHCFAFLPLQSLASSSASFSTRPQSSNEVMINNHTTVGAWSGGVELNGMWFRALATSRREYWPGFYFLTANRLKPRGSLFGVHDPPLGLSLFAGWQVLNGKWPRKARRRHFNLHAGFS